MAPSSRLAKISRGVLTSTVFSSPRLKAMPWMSGLVMPCSTWVQESPPSLLTYTPSISTPAMMVLLSTGSTSRAVTRGSPMAHSWAMLASSLSQVAPPSRLRNRLAGAVPTYMLLELDGSTAMDQIFRPSMGESSLLQCIPESSLR